MSTLNEIIQTLNHPGTDLKAESLIAFLEDSVNLRDLVVSNEGDLKRAWSKDVSDLSVITTASGREKLHIRVNRDGIYDCLPESVFHDLTGNDCSSGEEMAKESMRLRTEEKEARLFFQPLENEIFIQLVRLASAENGLYSLILSRKLLGLIDDFWLLGNTIPGKYFRQMVNLLPFAFRISGNMELTRLALAYVLQLPVEISSALHRSPDAAVREYQDAGRIGFCMLGDESILGTRVNGEPEGFVFTVGPIADPDSVKLLKNGILERFIRSFCRYFVPVYLDAGLEILLSEDQRYFVLEDSDTTEISHLGINSVI